MTPNLDAIAPVMKGTTAVPAWPKPAIHPMAPDISQCGTRRPVIIITIGYIGPRKTPIKETETAFATSDGTSQIVISSLRYIKDERQEENFLCIEGPGSHPIERRIYSHTTRLSPT